MVFELKTETFQGPLDKLLELVEEKKLEITKISLAEVTSDFLNYVRQLEVDLRSVVSREEGRASQSLLADFLVVASKLILIKSKILLPSLELAPDEEEDIKDFERRLKIYQELKNAQKAIKENWKTDPTMFSRDFFASMGPIFYPPSALKKEELAFAIQKIAGELEKILKPVETVKRQIINLKDKIEEI